MMASLARLADAEQDFRISIAGITEAQYLEMVPKHRTQIERCGDRLRFLGRIPHAASLDLLRSADFLVIFRQPNRVSNTRFVTKFVEAAALGVPVVSNPTSDIPMYFGGDKNAKITSRHDDTTLPHETPHYVGSLHPRRRNFAHHIQAMFSRGPFSQAKVSLLLNIGEPVCRAN